MSMCCDIRMMGFKGTSVLGYYGASKAQASKSGLDARIQVYLCAMVQVYQFRV